MEGLGGGGGGAKERRRKAFLRTIETDFLPRILQLPRDSRAGEGIDSSPADDDYNGRGPVLLTSLSLTSADMSVGGGDLRHPGGDAAEGGQDEFAQYYLKYRPLRQRQGRADPPPPPEYSSPRPAAAPERREGHAEKKRPWYKPRRRLLPPFLKSRSEESSSSGSGPPPRSETSPLQGLSGLLSDKMTFNSSSSRSSSLANGGGSGPHALMHEDSQSRDSGNSSCGSPDLRHLRKRRSMPPGFGGGGAGSWNRRSRPSSFQRHRDFSSRPLREDDTASNYSYETARDMLDPADVVLAEASARWSQQFHQQGHLHGKPDDVQSVLSDAASLRSSASAAFYDSCSSSNAVANSEDFWSAPMGGGDLHYYPHSVENRASSVQYKRKLDCLREDSYPSYIPRERLHRREHTSPPDKPEKAGGRNIPFRSLLSKLCRLTQAVLMILSGCLVVFGFLFVWRGRHCEADRQRAFDMEALRDSLHQNVFGQHVAVAEILREVASFSRGGEAVSVLVFVGWPGGGKTHTASLLRQAFPVPENVHSFSVPLHFADGDFRFLDDLSLHIARSCGHSMVVFDDVDSGSEKGEDGSTQAAEEVARFVGTLSSARLSSRSNGTLVVITSNAGGAAINQVHCSS